MTSLDLINIRKSYGPLPVLKGISLAVEPGEFTVLLGPSGCGKSTLLHAIAGLDDIDDGTIRIGGRDVTELEPKDRGIAMVFQSYALYPTMTVERNLSFGLRMAGMARPEIARRVGEAARMLQIEELLARKPGQLSGGQRQRVAIGRAIVRKAGVFLFDEPLSNLDAKLRTDMRVELKRLHAELGATTVYVTHDQVEAMTMASRIAVLRSGCVEQYAAPQELYDRPANLFVAGFVGTPAMNILPARLRLANGLVHAEAGNTSVDVTSYPFAAAPVDGQSVTLGFRSEDAALADADDADAIAGRLISIEPLGAETLAWVATDGGRICVRLPPDAARQLPVHVGIKPVAREISLFAAESGLRL
jgi:multiple sugar transport system ATP-binding protein